MSAAFKEFLEFEYLEQAPRFAAIAKSEADLYALAEREWTSKDAIDIRQVYERREGRDPVVIPAPRNYEEPLTKLEPSPSHVVSRFEGDVEMRTN